MNILVCANAAETDSSIYSFMIKQGFEQEQAAGFIGDLRNYRRDSE
jgi:hypothetical protein